jgi:hypothetical protein
MPSAPPRCLVRPRGKWALVMLPLWLGCAPLALQAQVNPLQADDVPADPSAGTRPGNQPTSDLRQQPSWARHDWQRRRPWSHGWYGIGWQNNVPTWGWWSARSATWGVRNVAAAAEINRSVTTAIDAKQNTIPVAGSSDQLLYGSLSVPSYGQVSFVVERNGKSFSMTADCRAGLLNGREPNVTAEAQLLHAACQVAFGPG